MKHYFKYVFSKKYRTEYKLIKLVSQIVLDMVLANEVIEHTNRITESVIKGTCTMYMIQDEPCFCGSGKKYKNCHSLEVQKRNPFRQLPKGNSGKMSETT